MKTEEVQLLDQNSTFPCPHSQKQINGNKKGEKEPRSSDPSGKINNEHPSSPPLSQGQHEHPLPPSLPPSMFSPAPIVEEENYFKHVLKQTSRAPFSPSETNLAFGEFASSFLHTHVPKGEAGFLETIPCFERDTPKCKHFSWLCRKN